MPASAAERVRRCRRRQILGRKLITVELDEITITEILLAEGLIGPEAALGWSIVAAAAKKYIEQSIFRYAVTDGRHSSM